LRKLASEGIYAPLLPVFPTKTFPNHYTLVTGLYPETHGIVSNTFFDPAFNATFHYDIDVDVADARWWGGEPLWITCEKNNLRSGMFFWPGSEAPIMNIRPTYYEHYDRAVNMSARIEGVTKWLNMPPEEKPYFITTYLDIVDSMGHTFGPDSQEVANSIKVVDDAIGSLIASVDQLKTTTDDDVSIIIVSDHGMAAINDSHVVFVDDCIDLTLIEVVDWSPILYVIPKNMSKLSNIYRSLADCHPNMTVYLREDTPDRWHFRNNARITPILGLADLGWSITYRELFNEHREYFNGGNHGYDNKYTDMYALFIAYGTKFKQQQYAEPFSNLDVFNLMENILRIGHNDALTNSSNNLINMILK